MFTRIFITRFTTIAGLAGALLPCAVRAQTPDPTQAPTHALARVTLTPYAGMYASIGKLRADSTVEFLQLMTLVAGARASLQVNRRLAIEAMGGWTPAPSLVAQAIGSRPLTFLAASRWSACAAVTT
jgi:hypothetical protein